MATQGATDGAAAVVVGAGITGAFAAWYLARRGAAVTVVERGPIGGQASGRSAGGVNPLFGPGIPGPVASFALACHALHLAAADDLGGGARPVDRLHVATDESDAATLADLAGRCAATDGFSARWLRTAELHRLVPGLTARATAGLLTGGNLRVDPGRYAASVMEAAVRNGATVVAAEVTGVRCRGGRAVAVEVAGGELACDAVVVATGPWCEGLRDWLGLELAVTPLKGELLLVRPADPLPPVELAWHEVGLYLDGPSRRWLGGTEEAAGFDDAPTEAARRRILAGFAELLPGHGPPAVERHVAGLRPVTADGLPYVGLAAEVPNACVAGGGGRKGMLYGPGLGLAAADLVTTGSTALPVEPCRLARPGLPA